MYVSGVIKNVQVLHLGILTNEQKEYNNMKNMFDMFSVLPTHYDVLYLTLSMYYV